MITRRLVDVDPLEDWRCRSGSGTHRDCPCDRGVVLDTATRRDADPKLLERTIQAVAGVIRVADGFGQPTPVQERRWRSAFASATGPLAGIAAAAAGVLDALTRGADDRVPLGPGELAALNFDIARTDPERFGFGNAAEWWPAETLRQARVTWMSGLSAHDVRSRLDDARFAAARTRTYGVFGPKQGEPFASIVAMLDRWEATVRDRCDELDPDRVVTVKCSLASVDLRVRWLIVTYQQAIEPLDQDVFRAVLYVPYVVRRWLFQHAPIRRGVSDLGVWRPGDDQATAALALGVRSDVGVDDALDAARLLRHSAA